MSNYPDNYDIVQTPEYQQELAAQRTFMTRVYGWMTIGLLVTAVIALVVSSQPALVQAVFATPGLFIVLIVVELGICWGLSATYKSMPAPLAAALFLLYSAITGLIFSILLLVYTKESIAAVFVVTGGMFGTMSLIGYTTKRDLSSLGAVLIMGLIGLILATIVNCFLWSPGLYWLITYAGVVIFVGLTAYDTQKIKQSYADAAFGSNAFNASAVFGAFVLYLDFINLFIYMLRLLGRRR